jgi:hypothetical protein
MNKYRIVYCISLKKNCPQKQQGLTILDAANKLQTPIQKMLFINTTNPVVLV